jgi:hypothetical protein
VIAGAAPDGLTPHRIRIRQNLSLISRLSNQTLVSSGTPRCASPASLTRDPTGAHNRAPAQNLFMANSRRFRLQYTLRALVIGVTLFALWGGYHANRAIRERRAVEILTRQGARIERFGGPLWYLTYPHDYVVYRLWGEEFVTDVLLNFDSPIEPEVVDALCSLDRLSKLRLHPPTSGKEFWMIRGGFPPARRGGLPPGSLVRFCAGRDIWNIELYACSLSDDDCRAIGRSPVRYLDLSGCQFSEEGLAEILKAQRLSFLSINGCSITGERLAPVTGSTSLGRVECHGTVVPTGLAHFLARCPNLSWLSGSGDDEFVEALGPHPSLSFLDLSGPMSARTPKALTSMPQLKSVRLYVPKNMSSKSEAEFVQALTKLTKVNPRLGDPKKIYCKED